MVAAELATGHTEWPELDQLRTEFSGDIHLPGSQGYAENVTTWHVNPLLQVSYIGIDFRSFQEPFTSSMPQEPFKPRVLLLPRGTLGCQMAVRWCVKHGYALSVKSGGHAPVLALSVLPCLSGQQNDLCAGVQNNASIAGEVCIMLGHMRGVHVDAAARVVSISGACMLMTARSHQNAVGHVCNQDMTHRRCPAGRCGCRDGSLQSGTAPGPCEGPSVLQQHGHGTYTRHR